jgi:hypothetical protein
MWLPAKAQSPPRDAASCLCAGIALERRVDLIGTALYLTLSRRQSYSEASQSTRTRHSQWFIGTSRPLHVPDVSGAVTSRFPSASQMPFAAERHHHGKAHHPGRAACCRVDLMPVRVEAQSDARRSHSVVVRREKTGRTSSARTGHGDRHDYRNHMVHEAARACMLQQAYPILIRQVPGFCGDAVTRWWPAGNQARNEDQPCR